MSAGTRWFCDERRAVTADHPGWISVPLPTQWGGSHRKPRPLFGVFLYPRQTGGFILI